MSCLSKGLGAPIGSMLAGEAEFIKEARRLKILFGGAWRQAGILAAAGLIALEEGPKRLHEDHANARLLAEKIAETPAEIDLNNVQTNIVIFKVPGGKADAFVARLKERGILASTVYRHSVRFVTHRDVDRAACEEAARVSVGILKQ